MKKLLLPLVAMLGLSCAPETRPVPLNAQGLLPEVHCFQSPSCPYCEQMDEFVENLEERFGGQIRLYTHCVKTKPEDKLRCWKEYGQDAIAGSNRLAAYGGKGVPVCFVDGRETENRYELCVLLGQEPDCAE